MTLRWLSVSDWRAQYAIEGNGKLTLRWSIRPRLTRNVNIKFLTLDAGVEKRHYLWGDLMQRTSAEIQTNLLLQIVLVQTAYRLY